TTATRSPRLSGRTLWKMMAAPADGTYVALSAMPAADRQWHGRPLLLIRERLQIPQQCGAAAVELIEALGGITQGDDVLHRRIVQPPIGVPGSQPLPRRRGITRRQLAAHGDDR